MSKRPSLIPKTRVWGLWMASLTAIISGVAIFVNSYGVKAWSSSGATSTAYTGAKNLIAAVVLLGALTLFSKRRSEDGITRPRDRAQWLGLGVVGVLGGGVAFLLFFEGLARAVSTQAALIHKSLLIWVGILAVLFLREKLGVWHVAALGLLVGGQLMLAGGVNDLSLGSGEVMILAATLIWSIEVIVAKKLLRDLSPLTLGSARMGIGFVVLAGWGLVTGAFSGLGALGWTEWGWAAATGLILSGYVGTWFFALARAPAVDVTAVLVLSVVITAALQSAATGVAAIDGAWGLGLVAAGAALVLIRTMMGNRRTAVPQ
ncbi:MAG: DMT family transporter [Acidimicrobiia bacterium]